MTWEVGNQKPRKGDRKINEEIINTEGFLEEKEAKLLLYRFLRENISFTTKMTMGIELFPFQHISIKGMFLSDYFMGIWCIDENEYALTENGHKKIKNIEVGESVRSRYGLNKVLNKWENPREDGLEIITQSGDSFKAKKGHKTLTYDKETCDFVFKEIEKITEEDYIPVKYGTNNWGNKDIIFDPSDKAFQNTIPDFFLLSKKDNICQLLRHFFEKDGYCFVKCGNRINSKCGLNNKSLEFLRQVKMLLNNMGVTSDLKFKKSPQGYYNLILHNTLKNLETFKKCVGFQTPEKKESFDLLMTKSMEENFNLEDETEGLYISKVKNINPIKTKSIDITVENEENYIGNGIIHHNSRGLSKSFSTAIFAGLYAMLKQGVSIGIISNSFRQSKMIFAKLEEISKDPKAEFFNQTINTIRKSTDEWYMEIGKSTIRALPLGSGEKLRGFRFHVMIIDELLLMPEKIVNEVILPFLGVVQNPTERQKIRSAEKKLIEEGRMKEEEKTVFENNKLIGLSSASYKFEYLYKLYKEYESSILDCDSEDEAVRAITHFAYDIAPPDLYDKNLLIHAKNTMSKSQFDREFGAKFTDDSSGYFKIRKMMECTIADGEGQSVQIFGESNSEYIVAIDPSWSESDSSDNFAIQILKIDPKQKKAVVVHSYAMSGINLKKHVAYLHYILANFNVVAICMDYNGGLQFLNAFNESAETQNKKLEIGVIEADLDDPMEYKKGVQQAKNQYNKKERKYCFLRKPTSSWIRSANELLQASFDHKRILFAGMALDAAYSQQTSKEIDLSKIEFEKVDEKNAISETNSSRIIDFLEIQKENIEKTKTECAMIEVSTSPQGTQSFDLPLELRRQSGINKPRKDSYSALLLGNWAMHIYHDMNNMNFSDFNDTFTPMRIN